MPDTHPGSRFEKPILNTSGILVPITATEILSMGSLSFYFWTGYRVFQHGRPCFQNVVDLSLCISIQRADLLGMPKVALQSTLQEKWNSKLEVLWRFHFFFQVRSGFVSLEIAKLLASLVLLPLLFLVCSRMFFLLYLEEELNA